MLEPPASRLEAETLSPGYKIAFSSLGYLALGLVSGKKDLVLESSPK